MRQQLRGHQKPPLRVSYAKKIADDFQYIKDFMEYAIQSSRFNTGNNVNKEKRELYDLAHNKLNEEWFNRITNPYNAKRKENKNFPAKIEYYNLLYTNYRLLLGELDESIIDFAVVNKSPNAESIAIEELKTKVKGVLQQKYINYLNALGVDTQRPSEETAPLDKVISDFKEKYQDRLSRKGQALLTYMLQYNKAYETFLDMFNDWIIGGWAYSYVHHMHDEVILEWVNPFEIDYAKTPNSNYVEDADWVIRHMEMTPNEILDKFWHIIPEKDLKMIDDVSSSQYSPYLYVFDRYYTKPSEREQLKNTTKIEVIHWCGRMFRKVGILTYYDALGEEQKIEVDETYKLSDEDKEMGYILEHVWLNDLWEGWRIDGKIYLGMKPVDYQRGEMLNRAETKNPYNGKKADISIFELGLPWLKLWIIIWYRLELALAKSKGTLAVLPIQAIPTGEGKEDWDKEGFLWASEAMGMALIDTQQPGMEGQTVSNMVGKIDMNQTRDIEFYLNLLEYVSNQWDRQLGISDSRKAQQAASQGVGSVQAEIRQSNAITQYIFSEFEYLQERILQQMLDTANFAYRNGKKATLVLDDMSEEYLNLLPNEMDYADLGVFVRKSSKEKRKLNDLRQVGVNLASQGNKPSVIAEILDAESFAKIKKVLKDMEEQDMKMAQQAQQSEQQAMMEQAEAEKQATIEMKEIEEAYKDYDREFELLKQELEHQNNLELKSMESESNPMDNALKQTEIDIKAREQMLKEKKDIIDSKLKAMEIKQKDDDSRRKAETALKNKVVGEK